MRFSPLQIAAWEQTLNAHCVKHGINRLAVTTESQAVALADYLGITPEMRKTNAAPRHIRTVLQHLFPKAIFDKNPYQAWMSKEGEKVVFTLKLDKKKIGKISVDLDDAADLIKMMPGFSFIQQ